MTGDQVTGAPAASFAVLLRRLRVNAGLTQEKLADKAGVSYRSISDLERGINRFPRRDTARLLADALGLTGQDRTAFEAAARGHTPANENDLPFSAARHLAEGQPSGAGQRGAEGMAAATRTLPRDIASFTGRHPEIESLLEAVADGTRASSVDICAIGGMAGVGKTALAVHAAHKLADRFPDGQMFLQLHGHTPGQRPVDPADALASLLQAVGIPAQRIPDGLEPRAWLWRDYLADKRMLLLLDDAAGHEQVWPLLPGSPGTLVLITSRKHLTALADARVISLDAFPPEDAATLLAQLAARPGLDPRDEAIQEITRLCGYLPLAVGMLGGQLHHHPAWSAAELAADLASALDRLELMRAENLSVAAAFELSYRDLPPDEQRLLRYLGLHPGTDFDAYAAAALADGDLTITRRQVSGLYDHYLLSEPTRGRYRMHDLIAEYARTLAAAEPGGEREAAIDRLFGYYLHTARIAGRQFARRTPAGPPVMATEPPACAPRLVAGGDAAAWMDAEHVNLRAVTAYAASHGRASYAIEIPSAMHGYLRHHGNWRQVLALHEIALNAARQIRAEQAEASALTDIADIYCRSGDFPAAASELASAIEIHRHRGNGMGTANALSILGYVQHRSGEHHAAHDTLVSALQQYRMLGDRLGQAGALAYLSRAHLGLEEYSAAEADLEEALELNRGLGGVMEAGIIFYLGIAHEANGNYGAATASIKRAIELQQGLGNPHGQMEALAYLAIIQHQSGDFEASAASLEGAMMVSRSLGIQGGRLIAGPLLDDVKYRIRGKPKSAEYLTYAVHVYASLGLRRDEASTLNTLGEITLQAAAPTSASAHHERALAIATGIGAPPEEARAQEGLGRCLLRQGQHETAIVKLDQALAIYERVGSSRAEGVRRTLADLKT